jgi:L-ascorbate metabolism protein UlaG (beta-lactamase superfamily)
MELIYHGHSCVQIKSGDQSLIIDPFLSGNPLSVTKLEDIQVQYILLTHAHMDHILDALPIAKANDAKIVATFELANLMRWKGADVIEVNLGGSVDLGFAKAKLVQAFHSSAIEIEEEQRLLYAGMPGGYIIRCEDKTIYHAGDTALFSDMKMFGELHEIDLAFLPIGDTYTMGPREAAIAAEWLRAKHVVPIHYNTFPPIKQEAADYIQLLQDRGIQGTAMKPGDRINL